MMQVDGVRKGMSLVKNTYNRELSPAREIGKEVFSALEEERAEMAESIQEDIIQLISIAKMRLSGETAIEVNTYLGVALNKLKLLTFEIKPYVLEKFGLAPALAYLLQQRPKADVNFAMVNLLVLPQGIDGLMETAIFRLIQHLLKIISSPSYSDFGLNIIRTDDFICVKTSFKIVDPTADINEAFSIRNRLTQAAQTVIYLFNGHHTFTNYPDGTIEFSVCLKEN